MRELVIGSIIVTLCIAIAGWGDMHGFNAAKVRKIEAELAHVNARIKEFTLRDEQAAIDDEALRNEGYQKALSELGSADKCIVTPAMVRAIERVSQ